MIIIRRSKLNAFLELKRLRSLGESRAYMSNDAEWLMKHLNELVEVRKVIVINDDFTKEESVNTKYFCDNLEAENYDNLIGYEIDEHN